MTTKTIVHCGRCGCRCRSSVGISDAKMLRRSNKGLCVNCAVHDWLRNTYPCNMLLAQSGPKVLAHQHIRDQFAQIMRMGNADAKPEEINWNLINENWDLPFPTKVKPSAANPCSEMELDEIKDGKRPGIGEFEMSKSAQKLIEFGGDIKSFEQLNELKPGLGDNLKSLLPKSKEKIMAKSMRKQVEKDEYSKKDDLIKKTREPHVLPCKLSQQDRAEAANQLATAIQRVESLLLEKKAKMAEFKSLVDYQTERIHKLTIEVKDGVAQRSVDCELRLNYSKTNTILIRLDTEAIVEEREMTKEEKQMKFEFEKTKKK